MWQVVVVVVEEEDEEKNIVTKGVYLIRNIKKSSLPARAKAV